MKPAIGIGLALLGVLGAAGLAGCAGESLTTALSNSNAGAIPGATGSTQKKAKFNPFQEDGDETLGGRVVIKNPTMAQVLLAGPLPEMTMGRADAPVTVIKYASLTCPYCRKFQKEAFPVLKRRYIDTGKVRFILREFPIGHQSGLATIAWRCAPAKQFFKYYEAFIFNQRAWVTRGMKPAPIIKMITKLGMSEERFDSCRKNRAMVAGLNWIKERGRTLGVIGTPNFFVNEKLVKTRVGMKELSAMIDPLLKAHAGRSGQAPKR